MKPFNQLKKAKHGYCLYNIHDIYIGQSIRNYGEFSEAEVALFSQICKPNDTVIEVGANIGTHTQVFSKLVGDGGFVYAFEPQRVVFQTLCANMALNSITNVSAIHGALGKKSGCVYMPLVDYAKEYNFGGIGVDDLESGEKVRLEKLDEYMNEISNLKLIKIDVEGMEQDVLKGAKQLILKYMPYMYIENDRIEKSYTLLKYIDSLGYRMYWHLPKLYNPKNFAQNQTNIFGNIVSVNVLCIPKESTIEVREMVKVEDFGFHPMVRNKEKRIESKKIF